MVEVYIWICDFGLLEIKQNEKEFKKLCVLRFPLLHYNLSFLSILGPCSPAMHCLATGIVKKPDKAYNVLCCLACHGNVLYCLVCHGISRHCEETEQSDTWIAVVSLITDPADLASDLRLTSFLLQLLQN